MTQSANSRKRKRSNGNGLAWILAAVAAVLIIVIAVIFIGRKNSNDAVQVVEAELDSQSSLQKKPVAVNTDTETVGSSKEKAAGPAENVTDSIEEPAGSDVKSSVPKDDGQAGTKETATEAVTEPQEKYLANLDAYRVNDIIPEDKLDMEDLSKYFIAYEIKPDGNIFKRINGKSYRENNNISLSDLRYMQMPFYNFNGKVQLGEMIVNKAIASDVMEIFKELFRNKYQIEKMQLIDEYWTGDADSSDSNSIDHNNTSAFCYRTATGSGNLSRHALGMAIDINPQQNPYVSYSSGQPKWSHSNANDYIARDTGLPHVITHDDLAYKVFKAHGYTWGGDWNSPKDYQHFEMRK